MNSTYGVKSTLQANDSDLKINIEGAIAKYPDQEIPIIKRLDGKVFKNEVKSHKYEWKEREARSNVTTVRNATLTSSVTAMVVNDAGVLNKDDVIMNVRTSEQMVVTSVAGGVNVNFTRGWGDSTAAAMVAGDRLVRVGVAAPQGAKADNMVTHGNEELYNYTQIFEDVVELTGTQSEALIHGDLTQAELVTEKQKELAITQQMAILFGLRGKSVVTNRYSMGGLKFMIDTYAASNKIDFGGSWSTDSTVIAKIDSAVEKIALNNGTKPVIYAGYKAVGKMRLVQDDLARTKLADKARGIGQVDTWYSQLGELEVVQIIDPTGLMDNFMFLVDESKAGYKAMRNRGWFTKKLAEDGDAHRWQILGEYTFKLATPKIAAYLYNLGL